MKNKNPKHFEKLLRKLQYHFTDKVVTIMNIENNKRFF